MKKLITAAMTFIFAFTCLFSISAFASDEQIQPRASLYFDNYSSEVIPEGGGKISIDVSVKTKMVVKELGFTKVIVQEKSGTTWTDVATFTSTKNPELITKNTSSHGASVSYSGTKGKSYRAKVTVYAKDADGSDSKTFTSSSATA
ncbi:MAG: hypothetical protein HFE60_01240 [Anaerotignum sp.]|nr:hypothetical protein [Anaerotignum sp.]